MEPKLDLTSADGNTKIVIDKQLCKGCTICAEVCPKNVLIMIDATDKWEGTLAEIADIDACTACMLCEIECPDYAIRVYSFKQKKAVA